MTSIYLIRHCESEGNACRRTQAHIESLVTAKGYQQNEMLRRRFENIPINAIYSSDSFRSIMTVDPIAKEHGLPIRVRLLLREITTGVWEDMAWGDISREYPREHLAWEKTPWELITPGGSTFQQVADQLIEGIRRIARDVGDGTALAVSHSCSIKSALCLILGKPMTSIADFGHGDNTSVNLLKVDTDGTISVEFMNDCSHLPPHLRRAWSGIANSDINMGFDLISLPEDAGQLLNFAESDFREREGNGAAFDRIGYIDEMKRLLKRNPSYLAFAVLGGRRCGFVQLSSANGLPASHGLLAKHYLVPEYRGKGYSVQFFGYASKTFRYEYRTAIAITRPTNEDERSVVERFLFAPMAGHPEYLSLDLFVQPCPYPILA